MHAKHVSSFCVSSRIPCVVLLCMICTRLSVISIKLLYFWGYCLDFLLFVLSSLSSFIHSSIKWSNGAFYEGDCVLCGIHQGKKKKRNQKKTNQPTTTTTTKQTWIFILWVSTNFKKYCCFTNVHVSDNHKGGSNFETCLFLIF